MDTKRETELRILISGCRWIRAIGVLRVIDDDIGFVSADRAPTGINNL
jgi:hypothetical protein